MKAYKEKQYLVFDFEDGKNVKYDLSNACMIGKKGKPVVALSSQLSGYKIKDIINSFDDDKYKQFLKFVYDNSQRRSYYYNVGTFLSKIKPYSRFEQYFSAGVTNISPSLKHYLTNISKDLIKLSKEYEFILTDKVVNQYEIHKDIIRNMFEMEFSTITKTEIYNYVLNGNGYDYSSHFNNLLSTHKYNYKALMIYIDNLMTYEAIDRFYDVIRELNDYANMMSKLSNKFEKYPKNFLTTHKIASRNYNRLKEQFSEELYQKIRNEKMEYSIGDYKIIYPKSTQDIKDEAVQQQNCLASYIQKVLDSQCHILFMRNKDKPNESLVTLEVRDMKVVQSKGKFNRDLNEKEQEVVEKYNQKLLKIRNGVLKHAS